MIRFELGVKTENKKRRRKWVVLLGAIPVLFAFSSRFYFFSSPSPSTPLEPRLQVTEGSIKKKSTLYQSLVERSIPSQWIHLVISGLKPYVDFHRMSGGAYKLIADMEGKLVKFVYEAGPSEIYEMEWGPQGYRVQRKEVPLETYLVKVEGTIRSSLFEAMNDAGEQDQLALSFAEILAWEIDFYKDVREGDRFKVVVEKIYKEDQFIQYGIIHALEYRSGEKIIRGLRYEEDYYHEGGSSLRGTFLKAPLQFNRISSRFRQGRKHPILGGIFPHHGIDYAAPIGTPVWAVADGVVVSVGWVGGFGKQVVLRHANGYKTYYGHLSCYGPGIRQGQRVKQKQIVGYVGSTGLSTGPHLDYRFSKDSRFRNPLRMVFPPGSPIKKEDQVAFHKKKSEAVSWLDDPLWFRVRLEDTEKNESVLRSFDQGIALFW